MCRISNSMQNQMQKQYVRYVNNMQNSIVYLQNMQIICNIIYANYMQNMQNMQNNMKNVQNNMGISSFKTIYTGKICTQQNPKKCNRWDSKSQMQNMHSGSPLC
jgi:hypothetical protein